MSRQHQHPRARGRQGFSLVEVTVALTLLAFFTTGLTMMTVTASRQIGALEDRYPEKAILYLNPVSSSWGPQLGVAAVPGKAAKMLSVSTGQDHTRIRITSFKHDPDTGQVLLTATVKAKSP